MATKCKKQDKDQPNKQELRQMLVEKRDFLDTELRNKTKAIIASGTNQEVQRVVGDSMDNADRINSDYVDSVLTHMKSQILHKLNEAIQRFDEGHYGTCLDCGEHITVKRLEALPFATRCKSCEERREINEAQRKKHHQHTPAFVFFNEGPSD